MKRLQKSKTCVSLQCNQSIGSMKYSSRPFWEYAIFVVSQVWCYSRFSLTWDSHEDSEVVFELLPARVNPPPFQPFLPKCKVHPF